MQTTTVSIFKFKGRAIFWMLPQMQLSKKLFAQVKGLQFFKLMGSGSNGGFSIKPDFTTYALLCVWDDAAKADDFFQNSDLFKAFKDKAEYNYSVYLKAVKSHGAWSGQIPFTEFSEDKNGLIAAVTRARIKWYQIPRFWFYVPRVSKHIKQQKGLLFSIGVGEYPLFMQATFSIWENRKDMAQFAYKSKRHRNVVKKTRETAWYKEELFANFIPVRTLGLWHGKDPLEGYLEGR